MKFRQSSHDFSVDTLPISIGELDRVLRNVDTDIGSLYDLITPILFTAPGFRAGKFWFSLVNVTCTHTGFSYGLLPAPPEDARPLAGTWHFTFALGPRGYSETTVAKHVSLRGINTIAWGHSKSNEFITIATTHYQAEQLSLKYDALTPQWLYELLGTLTKSFALHTKYYTKDSTYQALYSTKNPEILRSQWHMMPLSNLIRNVPYPMWVYNRHVWSMATNFISFKHITVESLLYVCQNIRRIGKLTPTVEAEVVDQFHESLTDLIQRRENSEPFKEPNQLLYAALVLRSEPVSSDYLAMLSEKEHDLELPSSNYKAHIIKLLYD